jgi:hypothetical protein
MNLTTQCTVHPATLLFSSLLSSQIYGIVSHLIGLQSALQKKERKKERKKVAKLKSYTFRPTTSQRLKV